MDWVIVRIRVCVWSKGKDPKYLLHIEIRYCLQKGSVISEMISC